MSRHLIPASKIGPLSAVDSLSYFGPGVEHSYHTYHSIQRNFRENTQSADDMKVFVTQGGRGGGGDGRGGHGDSRVVLVMVREVVVMVGVVVVMVGVVVVEGEEEEGSKFPVVP